MALPGGTLQILAGASSDDIRQTAPLPLPAAAAVLRQARVTAADFDEYANVTLVDTHLNDGTAVTPADAESVAWVRYDRVASSRQAAPTFRAACASPAGGRIEVWLTPPPALTLSGAAPLDSVPVPDTGDRYTFTSVACSVPVPADAESVWLALYGPVRLDWFEL
jgi:beta-glucosidase